MVETPKRNPNANGWYRYYAGYREEFVSSLIQHLRIRRNSWILDPWNGSGTTTAVAQRLGYKAIGQDINPALVIVGKARSLDPNVLPSVSPLCADILTKARTIRRRKVADQRDPLCWWFSGRTANTVRGVEAAIHEILVSTDSYLPLTTTSGMIQVSSLAALFYQALFLTVRHFLAEFTTTNPTWITKANDEDAISVDARTVDRVFENAANHLAERLNASPSAANPVHAPIISLGESERIQSPVDRVGAVIGSPPYCTRIDYAVNTLPELALLRLGTEPSELRSLRDRMMGTPTMTNQAPDEPQAGWGRESRSFIGRVSRHGSKASGTYYRKYFLQYFHSLFSSLESIAQVLRPNGACAVVVQDSYYKEIRNDLARVVEQMGSNVGLLHTERMDFKVSRVRASMNTRARAYRSKFNAVESAVILKKPASAS